MRPYGPITSFSLLVYFVGFVINMSASAGLRILLQ